ncbi:hypothetical protein MKEN_00808100 [Mycena kentingensis (nom. inval.)]|nr:hypothetical protein MKEN_00808100 [Mycena kentingensis (nom. inval.)]
MGNGAKAAQKRDRNQKDTAKGGKSQNKACTVTSPCISLLTQLQVNAAAKSIICSICRQSFLLTTRAPALEQHSSDRHGKTMAECFAGVSAS